MEKEEEQKKKKYDMGHNTTWELVLGYAKMMAWRFKSNILN